MAVGEADDKRRAIAAAGLSRCHGANWPGTLNPVVAYGIIDPFLNFVIGGFHERYHHP